MRSTNLRIRKETLSKLSLLFALGTFFGFALLATSIFLLEFLFALVVDEFLLLLQHLKLLLV
jgi:hypothetical protein